MDIQQVKRHQYSFWTSGQELTYKENALWYVQRGINSVVEISREYNSKYNLGGGTVSRLQNLGYANLYGDSNQTYNLLYYFNQLSFAWFLLTLNDSKPISFQIANCVIETTGKFKNSGIGSWYVMQGIYAAQILRDQQALDLYAHIPVSFTEQANQEDLIWEIMLHFLQTVVQRKGTKDEAAGAYHHIHKLLDWDEYKKYVKLESYNSVEVWKDVFAMRKPMAEYLLLPTINIYHYILYQNQAGYEQAVYDALLKWKEYYTMKYTDEHGEEQDHSTQPQGYLALPIAAACAYAYDKGMKLQTVESDYIPTWMIEGRFDEFELLVKGDA